MSSTTSKTEQMHKELDLIQAIISRMASNSFEVKKWLIGILTAIIVFKNDELMGGRVQLIWVLLVPVLCFWYLDAFFLSTEKFYREMYQWVVANRSKTDNYLYDLNTQKRINHTNIETNLVLPKNSIWQVAISKTLWPFYLVPLLFIIIYGFSNLCGGGCAR